MKWYSAPVVNIDYKNCNSVDQQMYNELYIYLSASAQVWKVPHANILLVVPDRKEYINIRDTLWLHFKQGI